jgi:hypothetical protein
MKQKGEESKLASVLKLAANAYAPVDATSISTGNWLDATQCSSSLFLYNQHSGLFLGIQHSSFRQT